MNEIVSIYTVHDLISSRPVVRNVRNLVLGLVQDSVYIYRLTVAVNLESIKCCHT